MERLMSEDPSFAAAAFDRTRADTEFADCASHSSFLFFTGTKSVGHVAGHDEASHCLLEAVTDVLEICRLHSGGIIEQMN